MQLLWEGFAGAIQLLVNRDPLVVDAAWRSLWISVASAFLAGAVGIPIGSLLAQEADWPLGHHRAIPSGHECPDGSDRFALLCHVIPTWAIRWARHPLHLGGILNGEFCLAVPIIVTWTHGAICGLDPRVMETALTLGAGPVRRWWTYLSEARMGIALALLTAFARCFTELGIALLVGGNIKYRTRTLTGPRRWKPREENSHVA